MAEIFGTIAAVASLVEIFARGRDRFKKAAQELENFDKASISCGAQIDRLRSFYTTMALTFGKYHRDVEHHLKPKDQRDVRGLLVEMSSNFDRCEVVIKHLRVVMYRKDNQKELDRLQQELRDEVLFFTNLQAALLQFVSTDAHATVVLTKLTLYDDRHITFEISRRMSEGANASFSASDDSSKPTLKRSPTAGSGSSHASSSRDSTYGPPVRQNTSLSGNTLVRSSTLSSAITRVGTSTSIVSSGSSSDSTQTVKFTENERLQAAVRERNMSFIQHSINEGKTSNEKESRKASALILACRYKRVEIVNAMISQRASLDVTDERGLGVLHCAVGESEIIDEARAKQIVTILTSLVAAGASVNASEDSRERRKPLHLCAITGNYYAAQYLLSIAPTCVNVADANKKTALYHACQHHSPNERLVRLLLEKKATFGSKGRPSLGKHPRFQKIRKMLDDAEKKGRSLST